ncbi:hypothetical protein A7J50_4389 [Pseudomonas antarctica]|uniref:Uncharacterized protein n=1 Tax=Pseudomonas antarctica TaxID=219572 RepID=A0A172Z5H8_9PSED|nr:hypothetical protein [Pseudomonas antarctica]ANF87744.1 hypothetical protein A7J50_4389 [Pseudomonas antarctica]
MTNIMDFVDIKLEISTRAKSSDIEIISVQNPFIPSCPPHYLLIETKTTESKTTGAKHQIHDSKITVRATYISGDGALTPGTLVCEMGGDMYGTKVKLTNGWVIVDASLRGMHIGTYIFYKIVHWAKQFDPEHKVAQILLIPDARSKSNNEIRRNTLYENFGIRFDWYDQNKSSGISYPWLTAKDLIPYRNWPNITTHQNLTILDDIFQELALLKQNNRQLKASKRYYRLEYKTIRSRLLTIAKLINLPLMTLAIGAGLIIGKLLGWYQGF